jgi:ABC-type transport system involved in multi-copper enzyme maturation permease subunit
MTFLPIVERELRVASRRKSTFRFRSFTALLALVLSGFYLLLFGGFSGGGSVGPVLFRVLNWIVFALCLIAGVLLGADSLSEERREGTLGFLFLTDLKGYDVVLGKFIGVSLNAFYSLFAAIPVLALPIMIGGVTGSEYWRMMLALVNTLFVAFAFATLVSAYSKESGKAVGWASAVLSCLIIWFPLVGDLYGRVHGGAFTELYGPLFVVSPFTPFDLAPDSEYFMRSGTYWVGLAVSHAAGWAAILWTCFRVAHSITSVEAVGSDHFQFGINLRKLFRRDRRLLWPNPIVWLLDTPVLRRILIWLAIIFSALAIAFTKLPNAPIPILFAYAPMYYIAYVTLKLVLVPQACRFFATSRADGSFEVLCCSPLTDAQLIDGQWTALTRTFMPPALIIFAGQVAQSGVFLYTHLSDRNADNEALSVVLLIYTGFKLLSDFYAVGWFGMWMSLSSRSAVRATTVTVLATVVLPFVLFCLPDVLINLILIGIAQAKLRKKFQMMINSPTGPIVLVEPPVPRQYRL